MTDSVDELATNTEKLAIDEKYETNWCHLPPEMKRAGIEKMSFHTRYQLRNTASEEREIVDSLKYKFDTLDLSEHDFLLWAKEPREFYKVVRNEYELDGINHDISEVVRCGSQKLVSILTFALKTCDIDKVTFENEYLLNRIDWDNINTTFKPKEIRIRYCSLIDNRDFKSTLQFLKKCWNNVESISIIAPIYDIPFEEIFTIPSIANAEKLKIHHHSTLKNPRLFIPLIEKWIENDVDIGTKLYNWTWVIGTMCPIGELFDKFENRKISRQESTMRIRTDNDGKHILMTFLREFYFCCAVISSNLEESEYDKYLNLM